MRKKPNKAIEGAVVTFIANSKHPSMKQGEEVTIQLDKAEALSKAGWGEIAK